MAALCMSHGVRILVRIHTRVRSPPSNGMSFIEKSNELSNYVAMGESDECGKRNNRVMIVVNWRVESKGALDWALSHTVQTHDTIVLLHVVKPGKVKGEGGDDLLLSMKSKCQLRRPEVHVEMVIREGKDKGETIVEEAKRTKASLLVLGQPKPPFLRRLQMIWRQGKSLRSKVVDYCIQNAKCMTIAVRRKKKKYGGYLITTKRHNNFWLLA